MKQTLRYCIFSLLLSVTAFSQVSDVTVPPIYACDDDGDGHAIFNMYYGASLQMLAAQSGSSENYSTTFYETEADAANGSNFIIPYDWYENLTNPQTIYYRIQNLTTNQHVEGQLQLIVITSLPEVADVFACNSYTLPELPAGGNYYTQSGGGGTMLYPGSVITSTQTIYIYTYGCAAVETSFVVTIGGFDTSNLPPDEIYVCDTYVLPDLPNVTYYTFGMPGEEGSITSPAGTAVNQSFYAYAVSPEDPECTFTKPVVVYSGIYLNEHIDIWCEEDGIGTFNLTNAIFDPTQLLPGSTLSFYATEANAEAGTSPLPTMYTNTVPFSQTIYARYTLPGCHRVYPLTLLAHFVEYNTPEPIFACDENGDGIYVINDFFTSWLQIAGGMTGVNTEYFISLSDAQADINPVAQLVSSLPMLYIRITDTGTGCYKITTIPVQIGSDCGQNNLHINVYYDANNDGCGPGDYGLGNLQLSYTGPDGATVYTNSGFNSGGYEFENVPNGTGSVTIENLPAPFIAAAATEPITFSGDDSEVYLPFCVTASSASNDLSIFITPAGQAKPGFPVTYNVQCSNFGTANANGTATVTFDSDKLTFVSSYNVYSSEQATVSGNTISFNYELYPLGSELMSLQFDVLAPPTVNSGDLLPFTASISPTENDATPANNTYSFNQEVVNALDPNAMIVNEGHVITVAQAQDYLYYTILFQNTGTATASIVNIREQLDADLDWSTFQFLSSSHFFINSRIADNVSFSSSFISLPDSTTDEANSHGYITYRIKPKTTIAWGDVMSANADIYFDFNAPISTNTVNTSVGILGGPVFDSYGFSIFPNPASGKITLHSANEPFDNANIIIADTVGKTVLRENISGLSSDINVQSLPAGVYFITLSEHGRHSTKKLIIK